jgi:hypothetical protein
LDNESDDGGEVNEFIPVPLTDLLESGYKGVDQLNFDLKLSAMHSSLPQEDDEDYNSKVVETFLDVFSLLAKNSNGTDSKMQCIEF